MGSRVRHFLRNRPYTYFALYHASARDRNEKDSGYNMRKILKTPRLKQIAELFVLALRLANSSHNSYLRRSDLWNGWNDWNFWNRSDEDWRSNNEIRRPSSDCS